MTDSDTKRAEADRARIAGAENTSDDVMTIVEPDRRQKPPPAYDAPGPQVVKADTARSAPLGRPVFIVLVTSLAAAVLALGLYWMFWSSTVP